MATEIDHVNAALLQFPHEQCSDVVILGRGHNGALFLLTSFPEGDKAPLTQLVVEAAVHLGRGGAGLFAGRETTFRRVADEVLKEEGDRHAS